MNLSIALNRKVIVPAYVLLTSLFYNHPEQQIDVYMLYSELLPEDLVLFQKLGQEYSNKRIIELYVDRSSFPALPENRFWTIETYYRLLLIDMLPEDVSRILYLDVDMIVNKDIVSFYETSFDDKLLIAAEDFEFMHIIETPEESRNIRDELFLQLHRQGMVYFCAGMILFNITGLRKQGFCFQRYLEIFLKNQDYMALFDQDLLNYIHWKDVKYVDNRKYGLFSGTAHEMGMSYQQVKDEAAIIHFTGMAKPWTVNLVRYDIEKIWWEYLEKTPFYYEIMEQVFLDMMASTCAEDKLEEMNRERMHLEDLLNRYQKIIKQLGY